MDAVNFWVIAGGMAAVAAFGLPVGAWAVRRWKRRQHQETIIFGDVDLDVPPLKDRLSKIDETLGTHTKALEVLMAEHSPNGGKSNWDALVTIDDNLRALAADRGVDLPDRRPLRERKPRR